MTFPAIFALVVGTGMIGQWIISYTSGQIPEFQSEPFRIWFHIVGEMATALALVISGFGLLMSFQWGPILYLLSGGMLTYTIIVSPGYFAQKGRWGWVIIFGLLLVLSVLAIITVVRNWPA